MVLGLCSKQCWQHKVVFLIVEQGLHRVKAFSASHPIPPVQRLGVLGKLGENIVRTADPTDPGDILHHYGVMLII